MAWLPEGKSSLTIRLAMLTEYRRVTDGETDILQRRSPPRYAYPSRGKNRQRFVQFATSGSLNFPSSVICNNASSGHFEAFTSVLWWLLTANQTVDDASDWIKLGGVDKRVGADI